MTRRDNRKRLTLPCATCGGAGSAHYGGGTRRCSDCHGRGQVKVPNPFYVAPGEHPTWFQLGGGEGWSREVRRQLEIGEHRCWGSRQSASFRALCGLLAPWRIGSSVHCNHRAVEAIAPIVEKAFRNRGSLERPGSFAADTGWTRADLGAMLVEIRNRRQLWSLGRVQARKRNARFDLTLIPDQRIDALIQTHRNLDLVEQLRAERNRRFIAHREAA